MTENVKNLAGIFNLLTCVENILVYTGKKVPVFPVHFCENVPKFETVTVTHSLTLSTLTILSTVSTKIAPICLAFIFVAANQKSKFHLL